jgi:hypothetical protein
MKDDYLWDRTGEPDAEIADLERRLSVFKYRKQTFQPKVSPVSHPVKSANWMAIAAAFVGAAVLALGLWLALNRGARDRSRHEALQANNAGGIRNPNVDNNPNLSPRSTPAMVAPGDSSPNHTNSNTVARNTVQHPLVHRSASQASARTRTVDSNGSELGSENAPANAVAAAVPNSSLIDPETARHIERAQTLLLSFKNSSSTDGHVSSDVTEDQKRCRAILSSNIVLRKNAEQRGNLPIQELLGSIEPILLDIANLPDRPSAADVRDIQNRIKKNEILVALEVYSPPAMDAAF